MQYVRGQFVHIYTHNVFKIDSNIFLAHALLAPCGLIFLGFPVKCAQFLISSMRTTCPVHLIHVYFIIEPYSVKSFAIKRFYSLNYYYSVGTDIVFCLRIWTGGVIL
jgi:hypothetical protein